MKSLKFNDKDRADLKAFTTLASKQQINITDFKNWAGTVTNPAICRPDNIKLTAKGELSVRKLTDVLAPMYKVARTKVLDVPKVRTRKAKAKPDTDPEWEKTVKDFLTLIKNRK